MGCKRANKKINTKQKINNNGGTLGKTVKWANKGYSVWVEGQQGPEVAVMPRCKSQKCI